MNRFCIAIPTLFLAQCLNVTNVEPSVRNQATGRKGASCVTGYPVVAGLDCNNTVWKPRDPRLCIGYDRSGGKYDGVCGIDGLCYHSDVGFDGTIKAYQALKVCLTAPDTHAIIVHPPGPVP